MRASDPNSTKNEKWAGTCDSVSRQAQAFVTSDQNVWRRQRAGWVGSAREVAGVSKHQGRFSTSKDETRLTSKLLYILLHMLHTRRHTVWGLWGLWCVSLKLWGPEWKGAEKPDGQGSWSLPDLLGSLQCLYVTTFSEATLIYLVILPALQFPVSRGGHWRLSWLGAAHPSALQLLLASFYSLGKATLKITFRSHSCGPERFITTIGHLDFKLCPTYIKHDTLDPCSISITQP